jgi:hypothetical protein
LYLINIFMNMHMIYIHKRGGGRERERKHDCKNRCV